MTGIGVFAQNLTQALRSRGSPSDTYHLYRPPGGGNMNTARRILWETCQLPLKARKDKVDVLYTPGFSSPPVAPCPRVVTVHDLIGLIYPRNVRPAARFYWTRWLPANVKKAESVVASSESTRKDLVRLIGLDERKIRVVPLAAGASFQKKTDPKASEETLKAYGIQQPFFIAVSSLEPRKNFLRLLRAYEILKKRGRVDFSIVIAGKPAGSERQLTDFVRERGLADGVRFLGYVDEKSLINLYNSALGYVTISLYEGFGLTALEAMKCGLSGVVSNRSSLPEVVGNTALIVDPENEEEIAEALSAYAGDGPLRRRMAEAAYERSKQFSIELAADRMSEIFKKFPSKKRLFN